MKKKIAVFLFFAVPIVAYLVLQTGKNDYKQLEILGPKEPVKKTINGKEVIDTLYHTVGGFSFYDQDSVLVNEKITEGSIYVVDFFFSTCKTICPKMTNQFMRVQHKFKSDDDVKLLSFTVDPLNDTPARLKEYATKHKAIKGKWYFLTGDKVALYSIAKESFFLTAMEDSLMEEGFLHSEQVVLVDKEKRIRGFYDGTDIFEVKKLIEDISTLKKLYARDEKIEN